MRSIKSWLEQRKSSQRVAGNALKRQHCRKVGSLENGHIRCILVYLRLKSIFNISNVNEWEILQENNRFIEIKRGKIAVFRVNFWIKGRLDASKTAGS